MSSLKNIAPVCILSALGLAACAQTMPKELADARAAYDRAVHGPAEQLAPSDLHVAHSALEQAEQAYNQQGDSQETRDLAYIAERRAEIAEINARTVAANHSAADAEKLAQQNQAQERVRTQSELDAARRELEANQAALSQAQAQKADAEKRAQQALNDLQRVAAVKEEQRGTVITLSGSVLFPSGKADILGSAEGRLAQVADALSTTDPDSQIVVEGYTDSQGSTKFNEKLSQNRAESVRSYLISHGVAPDRIRAEGLGPAKPIADNTSSEGRANNRRVEIVVQPGSTPGGQPGSTPGGA
jgi:outer membrane protein OmpA-like peptidoglycan-associated protein